MTKKNKTVKGLKTGISPDHPGCRQLGETLRKCTCAVDKVTEGLVDDDESDIKRFAAQAAVLEIYADFTYQEEADLDDVKVSIFDAATLTLAAANMLKAYEMRLMRRLAERESARDAAEGS